MARERHPSAIPSGGRFLTKEGRIVRPGSDLAALLDPDNAREDLGRSKRFNSPGYTAQVEQAMAQREGLAQKEAAMSAKAQAEEDAATFKERLKYDPESLRGELEASAGVMGERDSSGGFIMSGNPALPTEEQLAARGKLGTVDARISAAEAKVAGREQRRVAKEERKKSTERETLAIGERYLDLGAGVLGFIGMREQAHNDLLAKRIDPDAYEYIMREAVKRRRDPNSADTPIPGYTIEADAEGVQREQQNLMAAVEANKPMEEEAQRKFLMGNVNLMNELNMSATERGRGKEKPPDDYLRDYMTQQAEPNMGPQPTQTAAVASPSPIATPESAIEEPAFVKRRREKRRATL